MYISVDVKLYIILQTINYKASKNMKIKFFTLYFVLNNDLWNF